MRYVANAFSVNMLSSIVSAFSMDARKVGREEAAALANGATPAIGHQDTANVVSADLGLPGLFARVTVVVNPGDDLIVAQYKGPRLPEGATTLPEGAVIEYWHLVIG
jgi:hypothetical protein